MATILREGKRIRKEEHVVERCFWYEKNGGYSFATDKDGNVVLNSAVEVDTYFHCMNEPERYPYAFNENIPTVYRSSRYEPYLIRCNCEREMQLWSSTNRCECGRVYNDRGQALDAHAAYCAICSEGGDCNKGEW
jgi:hypothetical protein